MAHTRDFPPGFAWGATLNSHKVEGGDFASDWWAWEQRPGRIAGGATSEAGAGHYARIQEDAALAGKFGLNALLVAPSWARVQPAVNTVDEDALAHYAAFFEALRHQGVEPFCALWAVAAPAWFTNRGGWRQPEAPELFARYARRFAECAAHVCNKWIPVFEPERWLSAACLEGRWPGGAGPGAYFRASRNLVAAQERAARVLRKTDPKAQVGVAVRGVACRPENRYSSWDLRAARRECARFHHRFLARLLKRGARPDFIGVGYYGRGRIRFAPLHPRRRFACWTDAQGAPKPAAHTEAHRAGLAHVLADLNRYGLPLYITGNGVPTEDDAVRRRFLLDHVAQLQAALARGIPVAGYFHRALLDGFEWTRGFDARYGLIHVDRRTGARTPNESAFLLKEIAQAGAITAGAVHRLAPGWQPQPADGGEGTW